MDLASYRREMSWKANWQSSRELAGLLERFKRCDLSAPARRSAARERSGTARTAQLTSDCKYPPSPTPERPVPPPAAHFLASPCKHLSVLLRGGASFGQSASCCEAYGSALKDRGDSRDTLDNHPWNEDCLAADRNEKGGWCKPPFSQLTPQNRKPSRGSVPATPGSQSYVLTN